MENKKGFTLVELIAVIILLAAITLVSVPVIINTLRKNEQKEYEEFKNLILNATELYVERNKGLYPELETIGGIIEINTENLINEGYLKDDLKNPEDASSVVSYKVVIEVGQDEILTYKLEVK